MVTQRYTSQLDLKDKELKRYEEILKRSNKEGSSHVLCETSLNHLKNEIDQLQK